MDLLPPIELPTGISLPLLAPLSAPLVAQLLHNHIASSSVVDAVRQYPSSLVWLHQKLPAFRERVARDLAPLVQTDSVSVREFLSLLRAAAPPTNRTDVQLLSKWRGRGILQARRRGYLEPQRAAAVLLARRLLPTATRNWLPDEILPGEPIWWCWRQDAPTAPITTCPVPVPTDLPISTLLWTPWSGATWLPDWEPVATGAMYCGGIHTAQAAQTTAQLWHHADGPSLTFLMEANDQPADAAIIRQTWVHLMRPAVLDRFTPIVPG